MLSPEVWNFPFPKISTFIKEKENETSVIETIGRNSFYETLIITCPDELWMPELIEDAVAEDNDYYKVSNCPLTEFVELPFIENFVKNGQLFCLCVSRNCIVEDCAAITPNGTLFLHLTDPVYQTLGLDGTKRKYNFYEVKINLKSLKHHKKVNNALSKVGTMDFHVVWVPHEENICPSSIAKYFCDRNITVTLGKQSINIITPEVKAIPSAVDVDTEDLVEWVGMVAHDVDFSTQTSNYISTYSPPESQRLINTSKITVLIAKGFFTSVVVTNVFKKIVKHNSLKGLDNYWSSLSIQSYENSLWQSMPSSPNMFQALDHSCNIFVCNDSIKVYSVGQLKYS